MLTKDIILKMLPEKESLRRAIANAKESLQKHIDFIQENEGLLAELDRVNEVYKGIPLNIWEISSRNTRMTKVPYDRESFEVYLNVHNETTYGLRLSGPKWYGGHFCGANWPSKEEAILAGKEYLVSGVIPQKRT